MTKREQALKALLHLNALTAIAQQAVLAQKTFNPTMAVETQGKVDAAAQFLAELRAELEKPEEAPAGVAGGAGAARAKLDEAAQQAQAGAQAFGAGAEEAYAGLVTTLQAAQPLVGALAALVRGR